MHKTESQSYADAGVYHGDCLEVLKGFPDNSLDAIVTDPPYGIRFMAQKWDYDVPSVDVWRECSRVAKPGAHLACFAGSRTQHKMALNIEDAGWTLRDNIEFFTDCAWADFYNSLNREQKKLFSNLTSDNRMFWVCGSGFPKSLNISKNIDKEKGEKRNIIEKRRRRVNWDNTSYNVGSNGEDNRDITVPATPEAEQWEGWGTGLKPAHEPIVLAMKPRDGTFASNVLKWGVGGLNIDGCRVGSEVLPAQKRGVAVNTDFMSGGFTPERKGRFPANVIHDGSEGVLEEFAKQGNVPQTKNIKSGDHFDDSGTPARFFYCAKASSGERNRGLMEWESNRHPTVKPLELMRYLCKLITPPNGVVLDPFMGSGTTGIACLGTNRRFIGIELLEDYFQIAKKRIEAEQAQTNLLRTA